MARLSGACVAVIAVGIVACGGKAVIDPLAAGGAGGTASGSGGTTSSSTTGTPPAMTAEILSAWAGADCMPAVPADPVSAGFTVSYDNTGGTIAANATIASARLEFLCGAGCTPPLWAFLVAPEASGAVAPGASVVVAHEKTPGSGSGTAGNPCALCGSDLTLEVVWDVDGATIEQTFGPIGFGCAY